MFVDSHCHIHEKRCDAYLKGWLHEAKAKGVGGFFLGGYSPDERSLQIEFKNKNSDLKIWTSAGFHPWWVAAQNLASPWDAWFKDFESDLQSFSACGELGLDASKKIRPDSLPLQIQIFERQLWVAKKLSKPLVLHVVKKHEDVLSRLPQVSRGLVHSFSGSWGQAKQYLDKGLLVSISGSFMGRVNSEFEEVIRNLPADRLLIETDAPDQPIPRFKADKMQPPIALIEIADAISHIRGVGAKDLLAQSRDNLIREFGND